MQMNVNVGGQRPMNQQPTGQPAMGGSGMAPKSSSAPWVVLIIIAVIIIAGLVFWNREQLGLGGQKQNLSGYQAVFLTNGQVYFGKLSNSHEDYIRLTDIYYLQVNQQLQPTGTPNQTQQQQNQAQPQLSLVKLGNELHGPTDVMEINRSQVLFYEDLKTDGKVAQAIQAYKQNNAQSTAPAATAPTTPTAPATPTTPAPAPSTTPAPAK